MGGSSGIAIGSLPFKRRMLYRYYSDLHEEIRNRKKLIYEALMANRETLDPEFRFRVGRKNLHWLQILRAGTLLLNPPPSRLGAVEEPLHTLKEIIWEVEDFLAQIPGGKKPRCPTGISRLLQR